MARRLHFTRVMELEEALRREVENLRIALEAPARPSWLARLATTLMGFLI